MEEIGLVKEVNKDKIIVELSHKDNCHSCTISKMCNENGDKRYIEVFSKREVEFGDRVKISMYEHTQLIGALVMFALPVVSIVFSLVIGLYISKGMGIIAGFIAIVEYFIILKKVHIRFKPTISEIIKE